MEIKYSISPFELKTLTTEQIRDRILIKTVFAPDEAVLTYSFDERFILGGIMPVRNEIRLEPQDEIRQEYFLQTREMGVINIGGKGKIVADGQVMDMDFEDGAYIGCRHKGCGLFQRRIPERPAKFYVTSLLSFEKHPTVHIPAKEASSTPAAIRRRRARAL